MLTGEGIAAVCQASGIDCVSAARDDLLVRDSTHGRYVSHPASRLLVNLRSIFAELRLGIGPNAIQYGGRCIHQASFDRKFRICTYGRDVLMGVLASYPCQAALSIRTLRRDLRRTMEPRQRSAPSLDFLYLSPPGQERRRHYESTGFRGGNQLDQKVTDLRGPCHRMELQRSCRFAICRGRLTCTPVRPSTVMLLQQG